MKRIVLLAIFFVSIIQLNAQGLLNSGNSGLSAGPKTYSIAGITVTGIDYVDEQALIHLSGLSVGDRIQVPGDQISKAIKTLWDQKLFSNVKIEKVKALNDQIYLNIDVTERKRMSRFKFKGVSKSDADELREEINFYKERIITDDLLVYSKNLIRNYYIDKGFYQCKVDFTQIPDTIFKNRMILEINVDKGKKVKIEEIEIIGNEGFSDSKIKGLLKETKERKRFDPLRGFHKFMGDEIKYVFSKNNKHKWDERWMNYITNRVNLNIFKSSKYLNSNFKKDKQGVIAKYNEKGYRDAKIVADSLYFMEDGKLKVSLEVNEGRKYYFRDIKWIGNTKYDAETLSKILSIRRGDVYNQKRLESRLFMSQNNNDVSSLYMDNGYLFFNVNPVEVAVEGDSIDLEIRMYEGKQARINKIFIIGNTKTNDHVILREIRTKPGQLFSRSDIVRTQRELVNLGYFNPESLGVNPKPNPQDGTVDIEYVVEERPSDQVELSGGWGGGRIVGTLGLTFNNFSAKNFFKKGAWTPLPSGDGQRLSVRAQSNGLFYQSYNFSFTEPWLGGRKPNSLTFSAWHSVFSNGQRRFVEDSAGNRIPNDARNFIKITGASVGLGTRLPWPDNWFTGLLELNYQNIEVKDRSDFTLENGTANNLFLKATISRNSISAPIYPRDGSNFTMSMQATLPYSKINNGLLDKGIDYQNLVDAEKYKWLEYYKWKITSEWFNELAPKLVLRSKIGFGFLGNYNVDIGTPPFERFYLGGSGFTNFRLDGREIIALRGYDEQAIHPIVQKQDNPFDNKGQSIISKYTMELRYPISLNPNATIFMQTFLEGGNTWNEFENFNPFDVKRSGGFGVRIFLPMFGLLGLDWGYRFDDVQARPGMQRSQIHFTIGANLGEL